MIKLLIIQNTIPHYRIPVYNALAEKYTVTVLHSGKSTATPNTHFREIITPAHCIGPFTFQSDVWKVAKKFDVVIAMFDIRWVNTVSLILFSRIPRLILWGHRYSDSRMSNCVRNALMKRVPALIQYNEFEIPRMIRSGIDKTKIFVAQNTIKISNHSDMSGQPKDSFLYVGRAQARKRVDVLLRAFAEVRNQLPPEAHINIVGDGDENERLKLLAKSLGISDAVVFHGAITDEKTLIGLFARAYGYVSPGPVGLGVLHSLAYGVPVVTNPTGKHGPEFQHLTSGNNSLLFNTFDELKQAIILLATNHDLARGLGRNAYLRYLSHGQLDTMLCGMIAAIESTCLGTSSTMTSS